MTIKRITFLQELLKLIGLDGRLHLEWISSAEARKFVQVVTDFTEKIRTLGPNPLPAFSTKIKATDQRPASELLKKPVSLYRDRLRVQHRMQDTHTEINMKNKVKLWLEDGTIDIFIGYKMMEGHPLPHCFTRNNMEEIDELVTGPLRYPLEKIATDIAAELPDAKIGILARDCNIRALNVLYIWNQLEPDNIKTVTVNCCPSNLKKHGDCSYLEAEKAGPYKRQVGMDNNMDTADIKAYDQPERLSRWMYEFQKCIKCYGCRDICPVCFCKECSLEHPDLVRPGILPPEVPIFHLVKAVHMAGRCIDCGLCEEVCPVDIPLRLLYRMVNEIVMNVFHYDTGTNPEQSPFSVLGDEVTLEPIPLEGIKSNNPISI